METGTIFKAPLQNIRNGLFSLINFLVLIFLFSPFFIGAGLDIGAQPTDFDKPAATGGGIVAQNSIDIGGTTLLRIAYGWEDIRAIAPPVRT